MTEIPEHLLKRSQSAKAKASGAPAPDDGGATPAATTPATVAASTPAAAPAAAKPAKAAPAAPPAPKPDIPVVAAAKARKKIPFWAMATLSILPLWVFMYARSLTPVEHTVAGPLGDGAPIYSAGCSSCHGAAGEGGVGYQFSAGEITKTFPIIEDQLRWVYVGMGAYQTAGIQIYGNPNRDGGAHITGAKGNMPAQGLTQGGGLTDAEILAVVCHERYTLGGADPTGEYLDEYTKWCSPESEIYLGLEAGTYTFENLGEIEGTFPVGIVPAEGHAADAKP